MRNVLLAFGLVLGSAAVAADPPGVIVVRPQAPANWTRSPAGTYTDPDRPGFVVIRPQRGDAKPLQPVLTGTPQPQPPAETPPVIGAKPTPPPAPQPAPAPAGKAEDGRVVLETWDAISIRGMHVGYFHVVVREYEREGRKFLYGVKTNRMWVARFGTKVEQWAEDSSMETAEGAVVANRVRQGLGRDQMLSLEGRVVGDKLHLKVEGQVKDEKEKPWPEGVLGVAKEATLFADRKPKPGDTFSYLSYVGQIGQAVKFTVAVRDTEPAPAAPGAKPRKLLRADVDMEPIGNFQLPSATVWCDAETLDPVRMESDVPSLGGKMVVVRTDRMTATRPTGKVPDLFDVQSIPLNRAIPTVHDTAAAVVYRVTAPKTVAPDKVFPADARQTLANVDAATRTAELTVGRSDVPPAAGDPAPKPGKECLDANFFVDWDNDGVKRAARLATADLGPGAGDLQKARAVERWVHRNMKPEDFSQAMATCSNVARTLSGDCTEYAMLAAGMCRAVGVPSRTALGVVCAADRAGKPYLAYHMWFEVYADGRWVGLDGTLGRGRVGPGHLKITDAHWHEEKSLAPLLPLLAVLQAGPKVDVLRVVEGR